MNVQELKKTKCNGDSNIDNGMAAMTTMPMNASGRMMMTLVSMDG